MTKCYKENVFILLTIIISLTFSIVSYADTVPASSSVVTVNGNVLEVEHRRYDNTLKDKVNYIIKGVAWSPAQVWPTTTYPPGGPFENDARNRMWQMAEHDFPRIREAGFNAIRLYYHPGLSDNADLYFDKDDTDTWDSWEDWMDGMPMIWGMKFIIGADDAADFGKKMLDAAYKNGLKVIIVVDNGNANMETAQKIVTTYKNHPAVLMWMIGNEFNYETGDEDSDRYMWRFADFYNADHSTEVLRWDSACEAAQEVASWIQSNDSNHPVAVCLGEPSVPSYTAMKDAVAYMTSVDIVGMNCYRGKTFKHLYEEWTGSDYVNSTKPVFFSEYGVDTWHYMEDQNGDRDEEAEFEDKASQKEGMAWQWDDIHYNLSANDPNNILLGGCVFEWVDEWWKYAQISPWAVGNPLVHDNEPGYPINVGIPKNPDLYPDGCMHEEWWGINKQDTTNYSPIFFYSDAGLLREERTSGRQGWNIYTWGLKDDESLYGRIRGQADYIDAAEGSRETFSSYPEYHYTGGTGAGNDIEEGHRCMYTEVWGPVYGGGWGIFRVAGPIDLSQYAEGTIEFLIKIKQEDDTVIGDIESDIFFKFEDADGYWRTVSLWLDDDQDRDGNEDAVKYFDEFDKNSTDWQAISIPVGALVDEHLFKDEKNSTRYAKMDLANMKMVFSITSKKIQSGEPDTLFWIDNVRYVSGKDDGDSNEFENADVTFNRMENPVVADYRMKYNLLNYIKTVFDISAGSYTDTAYYAGITKNNSAVIGDWYGNSPSLNDVVAAAFDPDTGKVVEWVDKDTASALDTWIDNYDDTGDNYVLAFAVNDSCTFLGNSTKLSGIGSTLYNAVDAGEPWVFVTHVVDGSSVAKKETQGAYNYAEVTLSLALDSDKDDTYNIEDIDNDGDGLTDILEVRYGTDVWDMDTDDDGINDYAEAVTNGTSPRNPDSENLSTDTQARLVMQPDSLNVAANETERYLYIENDGGEMLEYKVDISYTDGSGWLSVKYRDHSNNEAWANVTTGSYLYDDIDDFVLKVVVDKSSLSAGTNDATITITSRDDDSTASGTKAIDVAAIVKPTLIIEPASIPIIKADKDDTTAQKKFYITNTGDGTMSWTITENADWLSLSSTSGTTSPTEFSMITGTVTWATAGDDAYAVLKVEATNAETRYVNVHAYNREQYTQDTSLGAVDTSYWGTKYSSNLGQKVVAGDVNGDGFGDLILGKYYDSGDYVFSLVFGKQDPEPMDSLLPKDVEIRLEDHYDNIAIEDINGDAYDDLIMTYQKTGSTCCMNIIFGTSTENWVSETIDVNDYDVKIDPSSKNIIYLGLGSIVFGDVNGDSYKDMLIQARVYDNPEDYNGALLIFGSQTWTTGDITLDDVTWVPVTEADGVINWGGNFALADFDGDAYDDICIGGFAQVPDGRKNFIIYGKSSWSSVDLANDDYDACIVSYYGGKSDKEQIAGDVNGDGYADLRITDKLFLGSSTRWSGNLDENTDHDVDFEDAFGFWISPDMNADGYDEVVCLVNNNLAYYFGRSNWNTSYEQSDADVSFDGEAGGQTYNSGRAFVDIDNDGNTDVIIGDRVNDEAYDNAGQVYIALATRFILTEHELVFYDGASPETSKSFYIKNVGFGGDAPPEQTPWQTNENGTLYGPSNWNYTMGYHFTPDSDGEITKLGAFFYGGASKTVYLWNKDTGVLLAQAQVTSNDNWSYTNITPVSVTDGTNYTVAVYLAGNGGRYRSGVSPAFPQTYEDITINANTYVSGDNRPTNSITSTMYGMADITFVPGGSGGISWTASESESWITSLSPTSGTSLSSNDGAQITVNASRSGLGDGIYTGDVTVTSSGQSKTLTVKLYIGDTDEPDEPFLAVDTEHVVISGTGTSGTFKISNTGESTLSWSIAESESWITSVSASSGTTTTEEDTITVTVSHSGCTADQTGMVTVTWEDSVGNEYTKDVYVTMKYVYVNPLPRYSGQYYYSSDTDASFIGEVAYQNLTTISFDKTVRMNGDVNGDGYNDIIAASNAFNDPTYNGRVYVIFGKSSYSTLDEVIDDASDVMYKGYNNDRFGMELAPLADVNGDGYDDIITSAMKYNGEDRDRIHVIFGKSTGWPTEVTTIGDAGDASFKNPYSSGNFYRMVTGNVNGDEYDDIIVQDYTWKSGAYSYCIDIFFGKSTGWATDVSNSNADVIIWPSTGLSLYISAQYPLACGDINDDGYDDLILPTKSGGTWSQDNQIQVFFGTNSWSTELEMSDADTVITDTWSPYYLTLAVGKDVNNDDCGDVFLGTYYNSNDSYLIFGQSSWPAEYSATDADVTFTVNSNSCCFVVMGDFDRDGCYDILMENHWDNYLYYGRTSWNTSYAMRSDYDAKFSASHSSVGLYSGDFDGDDADDFIMGYYPYSSGGLNSRGKGYLIYTKPEE